MLPTIVTLVGCAVILIYVLIRYTGSDYDNTGEEEFQRRLDEMRARRTK